MRIALSDLQEDSHTHLQDSTPNWRAMPECFIAGRPRLRPLDGMGAGARPRVVETVAGGISVLSEM